LLVLVLLFAARPADACSHPYFSIFRYFDNAATVAHARVRAPGGKLALAVIETFKGSPGKQIALGIGSSAREHNTCTPKLRGTGIIFLSEHNGFVAAYDSFPAATKELLAAIKAYAAAKTPAARAAVLVEQVIANTNTRLGFDAALALADDPELLTAVTAADRDRLIDALPKARADSWLPVALARIGAPAAKLTGDGADLAAARTFEAETKPADLADFLATIPTGMSARGSAAFERCERLHGKRLADIRHTMRSRQIWTQLADRCRTGTPAP